MSDYPDTPITREEQYLAAGLDGGNLPDPITREEQYLHEIATKMQGGGGGGDGNPNYVEAYTGTLRDILDNVAYASLTAEIIAGTATATITLSDYPNIPARASYANNTPVIMFVGGDSFNNLLYLMSADGGIVSPRAVKVGGAVTELDYDLECTLTIIHHPMTGSLTPAEDQTFGGVE